MPKLNQIIAVEKGVKSRVYGPEKLQSITHPISQRKGNVDQANINRYPGNRCGFLIAKQNG